MGWNPTWGSSLFPSEPVSVNWCCSVALFEVSQLHKHIHVTPAHSLILRLVTLFIRRETPFALHKL